MAAPSSCAPAQSYWNNIWASNSISKLFMSRRRAAGSAIAYPLLPVGIDGGQGETTTTGVIWKWNEAANAKFDSNQGC